MTLPCWFKINPSDPWQLGVCHGFGSAPNPLAFVSAGELNPTISKRGEGQVYAVPLAQLSMGEKHPGNVESYVTIRPGLKQGVSGLPESVTRG